MKDPRLTRLAEVLVHYSTDVQPGDNVLIETYDVDVPLVKELIKAVHARGAHPFVDLRHFSVNRQLLMNATEAQLRTWAEFDRPKFEQMDAYINIPGHQNMLELSDVPNEIMAMYQKIYGRAKSAVLLKKKWVTTRFPSPAIAQSAKMSTEAFEDFILDVSTFDYSKMSAAMDPLKELMERTDRVRLVAPGTDLTFSIKGIPAVKCDGRNNVPDGEVFTAPVRDSVNGVITFNTPSTYQGFSFERVKLVFENGKIVEATANDSARINKIFDTDEGARYIGEFAIGFNPFILEPMNDILFDEKIAGSFHFTPGEAYEDADNGNRSAIHWDMVLIQRPEYGGGEIWFDDVLIRKDGLFVLPELAGLNPDALKG